MSLKFTVENSKSSQQSAQSSIHDISIDKKNKTKIPERNVTKSSQQSAQSSIHDISIDKKNKTKIPERNVIKSLNNNFSENNIENVLDRLIENKNFSLFNSKNNTNFQKILPLTSQEKYKTKFHEINTYKNIIVQSINNKFYNDINFLGKKCVLHVQLSFDGTLKIVSPYKGDKILCETAISAIKSTKLPIPPNLEIYETFKNITLNFSP